MRRRYPVPTTWLMTDERMGDALWAALRRLPAGSGVVLRHHKTPPGERARIARRIRRIAHARCLVLVVADKPLAGDGVHGTAVSRGLRTWSAHDRREALAGVRAKADVLFVSPIRTTHSHPGAPALGIVRAIRIVRGLSPTIIALGGMDARYWRRIRRFGFDGWAAIDAWLPDQKRNAVPT